MCPACQHPVADCVCRHNATAALPANTEGVVRVEQETKGRKGKGVTLITGVPLPPVELAALCTQLKKRCGSGGTVKDGVIEIQGDHGDSVAQELTKRGWTVKRR